MSLRQPFAQLMVRGQRRYERRTRPTDVRGLIAIHASSAVPSHSLVADAKREFWLHWDFANEGWDEREDLLDLPRSAIVGTAELVEVWKVRKSATLRRLGAVEPGEFIWEFKRPRQIEPITGLKGQLNLWAVPDEIAAAVNAAPTQRTPEPRYVRPPGPWDDAERREKAGRERMQFTNQRIEAKIRRAFANYFANHQSRGVGTLQEVSVDRRLPILRDLFGNRAWVSRELFIWGVRKTLHDHTELEIDYGDKRGPYDDFDAFAEIGRLQTIDLSSFADDGDSQG